MNDLVCLCTSLRTVFGDKLLGVLWRFVCLGGWLNGVPACTGTVCRVIASILVVHLNMVLNWSYFNINLTLLSRHFFRHLQHSMPDEIQLATP